MRTPDHENSWGVFSTMFDLSTINFHTIILNGVPGGTVGSDTCTDVMNGFHCGYDGKSRNILRTVAGGAAMMMSVLIDGMGGGSCMLVVRYLYINIYLFM